MFSSGTAHIFKEKLFNCSDGQDLVVCSKCGHFGDYNNEEQYKVYNCTICKDQSHLVKIDSAWSLNLFQKTLQGANVDISIELEPPIME